MTTSTSPVLDRRLALSPTPADQGWIVSKIFGIDINEDDYETLSNGIPSYFGDWYDQQCRDCAQQVSIKTHDDLVEVVGYLQEQDATTSSVLAKLRLKPQGTAKISQVEDSLKLALRVSCAVSIGEIERSYPLGQVIPGPGDP